MRAIELGFAGARRPQFTAAAGADPSTSSTSYQGGSMCTSSPISRARSRVCAATRSVPQVMSSNKRRMHGLQSEQIIAAIGRGPSTARSPGCANTLAVSTSSAVGSVGLSELRTTADGMSARKYFAEACATSNRRDWAGTHRSSRCQAAGCRGKTPRCPRARKPRSRQSRHGSRPITDCPPCPGERPY